MTTRSKRAGPPPATKRTQDPDGVRRDILAVATRAFVEHGYTGARVDDIAASTRTSKRMIYYYFGDKERLYLAVLEAAYRAVRTAESQIDVDSLPPADALSALVGVSFDYLNAHPDIIRLIMIENIHDAAYMKRSKLIREVNVTIIDVLQRLIARGREAGVFRDGLDARDLHMTISALCVFNIANRATFSTIFRIDMSSKAALEKRRRQIIDTVLRYAAA